MRTLDKIRAALDVDFSLADAYVAWFTVMAVLATLIGLLAIGGGQ